MLLCQSWYADICLCQGYKASSFIIFHVSRMLHILSDIPGKVFTGMKPAEFTGQSYESLESS